MSWEGRSARFFFIRKESFDAGRPLHSEKNPSDQLGQGPDTEPSIHNLTPLPSIHRFTSLSANAKQSTLQDAVLHRLVSNSGDNPPGVAEAVVSHYGGREAELYDRLQQNSLQEVVQQLAHETPLSLPPLPKGPVCARDIIDCWDADGNASSSSVLIRVSEVTSGAVQPSRRIRGEFVAPNGAAWDDSNALFRPVSIRRVTDARGDNYCIFHPAAKIMYKRPSGTKWFNCKNTTPENVHKQALETKEQWENDFKYRASELLTAHVCLCIANPCLLKSDGSNCWHVPDWIVLPKESIGVVIVSKIDIEMK